MVWLETLENHEYAREPLVDAVDWTTKGAMTQVKKQRECGSCWAFSTTESLEGAWTIATGNMCCLSAEKTAICTETGESYTATKGTC